MPGRPRNHAASTAILAATIGLLRERGYDGLTLDEVARVAGVGKSSLYARFAGRAELAAAAVASLQRELPSPQGELRIDLIAWLRAAERNLAQLGRASIAALLASEAGGSILAPLAGRLRRQCELARARGGLGEETDLDAGIELLVGALVGQVLFGVGAEPWPEPAVDAVLAALGASARSGI